MPLPPPARRGQPVRAEDFNALRSALVHLQTMIAARTPAPGPDIGHRYGPGGFTSFLKRKPGGGGGSSGPLFPSIVPIPETDPVEWGVSVTPGHLLYQNAGASESDQGVTGYLPPFIAGVAIDDPLVQPLPLPALVSYVYLRVQTDADGVPKFGEVGDGVTIEAFDEVKPSIHHVRPSPSGGEEEGDYYFLLMETESDGGTPAAPRVKRRIPGNRELPNQLVEIANIGGKREIYQGYLVGPDDKHELRTLEQLEDGDGAPIIRPLDEGDAGADPPVPAEEEGSTIPFRCIKKNNSGSVPYEITGEGNSVKVTLQGADDTYIDPFGGQIGFAGGLCTGVTQPAVTGGNLNLTINAIDYDESGAIFGSEYLVSVLYWRGGLYVGTVNPGDAPVPLDEISIRMVGV